MRKLRVMTIIGTRPEIIRLSRVIAQLDLYCQHTIVHTGQNYDYELNDVFFNELSIRKPNVFLGVAGETPAETIGKVIIESDKAMGEFQPEAILILGDTNSCLAAISSKRRKIPIFHMEAGNRCFDFRVPEEINRRIVDHTSDVNLTYSSIAREYLLREGIPSDQVIKIGSPMREVISHYMPQIQASEILSVLKLIERRYFLISFHREENVDSPKNLQAILKILNDLADKYNEPIIVTTHPRTRKRIDALGLFGHPLISFMKPFGFIDYIKLQINAHCVISDSGTVTEESSILNFPALNLREVQERPEGFEEGSVMFVGLSSARVFQGLEILEGQPRGEKRALKIVDDYSTTNVSLKVLRIIQSYTDFINQKVWRKTDSF